MPKAAALDSVCRRASAVEAGEWWGLGFWVPLKEGYRVRGSGSGFRVPIQVLQAVYMMR